MRGMGVRKFCMVIFSLHGICLLLRVTYARKKNEAPKRMPRPLNNHPEHGGCGVSIER